MNPELVFDLHSQTAGALRMCVLLVAAGCGAPAEQSFPETEKEHPSPPPSVAQDASPAAQDASPAEVAHKERRLIEKIRGVVLSFRGEPLLASIKVTPGGWTTNTNPEDGSFELDVSAGEYEIEISAPGYESQNRRRFVGQGIVIVNADLRPVKE